MHISFLLKIFEEHRHEVAIIYEDKCFSYQWLLDRIHHWRGKIDEYEIRAGTVVALEGDFSPVCIALFLALINKDCIVVPLLNKNLPDRKMKFKIAEVEFSFYMDDQENVRAQRLSQKNHVKFIEKLREEAEQLITGKFPGLILFSSGTSGKPKAIVHNFSRLLKKFKIPRRTQRMINFLLFDHIGGLNTMLYSLSNHGTLLTVKERQPNRICAAIEKHQIEVLPTSPTFLNMLLLSGAHMRYDMSSLKMITYGTEPMQESTLLQIKEIYPKVKLQQTYGLVELGILHSKSKSNDSLWVKIEGEGFKTRVRDGILQVKAESVMLGYLNAPSPFTEDGWCKTGDAVEVDGDYFKILGRKSELISVGGEKVYPAEIESIIQEIDNVAEVTVYGEPNVITGHIVCACITLKHAEDHKNFTSRLKTYCHERMESYKVPVNVEFTTEKQHGARYKKKRVG